jgi:hypothetical protein
LRGSDDAVAVNASSSIAGQRPRPTTEQACPASPAIRRRRKAIVQYRQYPPIGPSASITRPTTERQDLSLGGLLGSPSRRFARAGSRLHKQHAAPAGRRSQATGPRKRANVEGGRTLSLSRKLPRFGSCATAVDEEGLSEVEGRGFLFKERREEACPLSIACPRPVRRLPGAASRPHTWSAGCATRDTPASENMSSRSGRPTGRSAAASTSNVLTLHREPPEARLGGLSTPPLASSRRRAELTARAAFRRTK